MGQTIPTLPQGHALNEYRIEKLLGAGGFGLTYLATDTNLSLHVAIKEYLPADAAVRDEDNSIRPRTEEDRVTFDWGLARFLDEARTLATFRHPNIVRVMRFFQANNTAYMVMEFVHGAQLSDWIKVRRPLTEQIILQVVRPLAEGLGVIHQAGYLHRDVKPGNIYMREDGTPVLLDFGAARATQSSGDLTAVVSPGYAPVEQYSESSAQGAWSDLYALGGVMYWMVTGTKPVDATARIKNDPQKPATDIGDAMLYSRSFLTAIDWALNPDDAKRPQSSGAFLLALGGAAPTSVSTMRHDDATRTLPVNEMTEAQRNATSTKRISDSSTPVIQFDTAQLKLIEIELAKRIGPLASVLIRKAQKKAQTIEDLIAAVAPEIEDDDERVIFTKRAKATTGNTQPPTSLANDKTQLGDTRLALAKFDERVLARAENRLAQHIGALAKIVVKKAAIRARDEGELYLIIADEIENKDDRKAFIKKAISISARMD
jgi:serine/threonine protein kinase